MIKNLSNVKKIYHNGKQIKKIIRGSDLKVLYGKAEYTVTLGGWRLSTSVSNPNPTLYDGVYESNSNYHVSSGTAYIYIDIEGYTEFTIYVRSYGESNYDYVTVSNLDTTPSRTSGTSSTVKYSFYGRASSSTYTPITYTNIPSGSHRITVLYGKDSSVDSNSDRGYLYIPKNQ